MDVIGFRAPATLWDTYASVVGERGRSADLRRYIEWRVENPHVLLGADPGPAGAGPQPHKFEIDKALSAPYLALFKGDGLSADLRAYIAWRVEHYNEPLPGQGRLSVRNNRPPSES
jgi:hypothetical protein